MISGNQKLDDFIAHLLTVIPLICTVIDTAWTSLPLQEIKKFIPVTDKRNVLKSSGGKSYGPFGRIIEESKRVLLINNDSNYERF
jgi:hypothetical protein